MNKILITAALAAFTVTPALAQQPMQAAPSQHYGAPTAYAPAQPNAGWQMGPFGYQPGAFAYEGQAFAGPGVVVSTDGRIVGQDPDPGVQSDLQRTADQLLGNGAS